MPKRKRSHSKTAGFRSSNKDFQVRGARRVKRCFLTVMQKRKKKLGKKDVPDNATNVSFQTRST